MYATFTWNKADQGRGDPSAIVARRQRAGPHDFSAPDRVKQRLANPIERLKGKIKRGIEAAAGAFPNALKIDRDGRDHG